MRYEYQNWACAIFMGFYESPLFYSDTEYYLNEYYNEDNEVKKEYEVDFIPYTQAVCEYATDLLADYCVDNNIVKSMQYKSMSSPQYYNYSTDKLNIIVDLNLTKLKKFIRDNKEDFNMYLHDNFTSYDGFCSFVSNNYNKFMQDYKEDFCGVDKCRCINVMLEYYILTKIYDDSWAGMKKQIRNGYEYDTPYHWQLFERNNELQYNFIKEVETV
jgi:hypothetical protein